MSRRVRPGDFLLTNSMSFGRPYIMKTDGCIHDGWLVLRDESGRLDSDYLYHFLGSDAAYRQFDALAAGSTVRNLNTDLVKGVKVVVPPLSEQQRIVAILDEAFEGIAAVERATSRNLQAIQLAADTAANEWLTAADEHWTEVALSDVCEISARLVDPRLDEFADLPHVGAGNMETRTGRLSDVLTAREEGLVSGKFLFGPEGVLYSKIRPYLMKACRPNFRGLCSADVYPLIPKAGRLERDFLFHILMARDFTAYAKAGSARAGMPKLNREHLFAYRLLLPPPEEQARIAKQIDALAEESRELSARFEQKLKLLAELKQSLLARAFSGELTREPLAA